MSGGSDGDATQRLRAKLAHERVKVRKLVESQDRLLAERNGLHRQLAVLESQHRLLMAAASAGRPVPAPRILVAGPVRKTIFEFVRGATISSDPAEAPFDLLVISRPEKQDLGQLVERVPEAIWSAVRAGRTRLVLDGASEGNLHRAVLEGFRALAERTGTPLGEIIYLTQDRLAAHRPGPVGKHLDVPLPVINHDYHMHKALYPLLKHGQAAFEARLERYLEAPRQGRRAFLSLNLAPRAHRVLLLSRLLRDGLWDKGFISFGGFGPAGGEGASAIGLLGRIDWRGLEAVKDEAAPWILELHAKGVALFGLEDRAGPDRNVRVALQANDLPEYRRSWFSVVTETEMRGDSLRVTEKVLKPVLSFHPFIVFGSPGALQLVRCYGLQTFPELFDESYDDEEDPARRFEMVYGQVRRLACLDEPELDRLEASVAEKVVFNARWGLTGLPRLFQETLLQAIVGRLLPPRSDAGQGVVSEANPSAD